MAKANADWKVGDNGPIEPLAENLWRVEGSLPGMSLRRVMAVARMDDGRLVLHSAIALDEQGMLQLESLGQPAFLLVPNGYHRLDAPAYKRRYPTIQIFTPQGSRAKAEEVVTIDGTYDDFPNDQSVWLERLAGIKGLEGAMFVRSGDGVTVVLNDAVFNMDKKRDLLGYLFTTLLGSAGGPRVSRLVKWLMVDDKVAFRSELHRLADTPELVRLLVAHEKVARGPDARRALLTAADSV